MYSIKARGAKANRTQKTFFNRKTYRGAKASKRKEKAKLKKNKSKQNSEVEKT